MRHLFGWRISLWYIPWAGMRYSFGISIPCIIRYKSSAYTSVIPERKSSTARKRL